MLRTMMYIGKGGADAIRRRVATDVWAHSVAAGVIERAQAVHRKPLIERVLEPGRPVMLGTSRDLAERVHLLGMARILDGDPRHARRLAAELEAAAAFPDWNPVHFIDAAEMMAAVALGRDWLGTLLPATARRRIDAAILTRGLEPALRSLRGDVSWTRATTNWNIVCSAGPIIAALVLRAEHPTLADEVIARAASAMQHGMASFAPDGGWPEGPSYAEYAMRYAVLAIAALQEADRDSLSLAASPGFLESWRFGRALAAPSGLSADYGDNLLEPDRPPVLGWLALGSGNPEAARWQRSAPGETHPLDLVWCAPQPDGEAAAPEPRILFAGAGIAVLRGPPGSTAHAVLRGGANSTNHSHLDLGSVIFETGGHRFVSDLGRDDYALPGYFRMPERFSYRRIMTASHNTVTVGDRSQSPQAIARDLETAIVSGHPAAALLIDDPEAPVLHERAIGLVAGGLAVTDHLTLRDATVVPAPTVWRIHTRGEVEASGAEARIRIDDGILHLVAVAPAGSTFSASVVPSSPGEADNSGFTALSIAAPVPPGGLRVTVLLQADADAGGALADLAAGLDNWLRLRQKMRDAAAAGIVPRADQATEAP